MLRASGQSCGARFQRAEKPARFQRAPQLCPATLSYTFAPRCLARVEDYDHLAITVPKDATQMKYIAAEFFATMEDPALYQTKGGEPAGLETAVSVCSSPYKKVECHVSCRPDT